MVDKDVDRYCDEVSFSATEILHTLHLSGLEVGQASLLEIKAVLAVLRGRSDVSHDVLVPDVMKTLVAIAKRMFV
jgi:hypothetical protein